MSQDGSARSRMLMLRLSRDLCCGASGQTGQGLSPAEWERYLWLADIHTVSPLLFAALQQAGRLPELPEDTVGHLRQAYENTRSRADWMLPEFHALVEGLQGAGVDVLILKGLPLIQQLYGDWGMRPSYDIDFWLRDPGDAMRAIAVLEDLGYELFTSAGIDDDSGRRHLAPRWKPAPRPAPGQLYHPRLPWTVEPHVRFWESQWWGLRLQSPEHAWERRSSISVQDRAVPVLGLADELVYLCVHEVLHLLTGNARLIHLCDIDRLARRLPAATWEATWALANDCALESHVGMALVLARKLFDTPLPASIEASLGHDLRRWLRTHALDDLLSQDWAEVYISRVRLARLSPLLTRSRAAKCRAMLVPLTKIALPPARVVRRRYGLGDDGVVWPYYIPYMFHRFAGRLRSGHRSAGHRT